MTTFDQSGCHLWLYFWRCLLLLGQCTSQPQRLHLQPLKWSSVLGCNLCSHFLGEEYWPCTTSSTSTPASICNQSIFCTWRHRALSQSLLQSKLHSQRTVQQPSNKTNLTWGWFWIRSKQIISISADLPGARFSLCNVWTFLDIEELSQL